MERIRPDGTPYPGQARWCTAGEPYISLRDLLGNLFFERPGYFRVIAFVVTHDANFGAGAAASLPPIRSGFLTMPDEMRSEKFDSQKLLALIYTFERKNHAQITSWDDSWAPSAQQHLMAAGLWPITAQR
jgi:hypothetical protein